MLHTGLNVPMNVPMLIDTLQLLLALKSDVPNTSYAWES